MEMSALRTCAAEEVRVELAEESGSAGDGGRGEGGAGDEVVGGQAGAREAGAASLAGALGPRPIAVRDEVGVEAPVGGRATRAEGGGLDVRCRPPQLTRAWDVEDVRDDPLVRRVTGGADGQRAEPAAGAPARHGAETVVSGGGGEDHPLLQHLHRQLVLEVAAGEQRPSAEAHVDHLDVQ